MVGPDPLAVIPSTDYDLEFANVLADVRRYTPVGWGSELDLRVVAGGGTTEHALPPQYQHALGGPGTLPGFETFYADCGARARIGGYRSERFFPSYGCDRFAAFQVEYRGGLSIDLGFGDPDDDDRDRRDTDWWDWDRDWDVDLAPSWAVFFDAGQGWAFADPALGLPDRDTGVLYDAGVGLLLGDLGFYAVIPLNGDVEQEPRFLVRLGRRF